jgi:outer membrane protein assembly factor BamB
MPVAAVLVLSGCWLQPGADPHRSGHNQRENGLTVDNVATLTQAWSVSVGTGPVDAPVVSGLGVFATSDTHLASYRLDTGAQIWRVDASPIEGVVGYPEPPRVRGDELRVPVVIPFRGASYTAVYDARTGTRSEGGTHFGLVTLDGDTLIATESRVLGTDYIQPYLHSTDLADPSQSWEVLYPGGNLESAVSDEWIISILGTAVNAFPRSGPSPDLCEQVGEGIIGCRPAWSVTLGGQVTAPAISDDGQTVFVGDVTGTLSALNIADGTTRWTSTVGAGRRIFATPTVGDGSVFVTTEDGYVFAFGAGGCDDEPPCDARWVSGPADGPVRQQAALAGGVLYVAANDGSIRAFDAGGCVSYCNPLWQTFVGRAITGAPAVARGHLVVGTTDGRLIAFAPAA